jgi:hypothetical protein
VSVLLERLELKKKAARQVVSRAIKAGRLRREPCQQCGAEPTDAHHKSYDRPLDVLWLCRSCHRALHARQIGTCSHGHGWTKENTRLVLRRGRVHRACRACAREWRRAHYQPKSNRTCRKGHLLEGRNLRLLIRTSGKRERVCRKCVLERNRRNYDPVRQSAHSRAYRERIKERIVNV